MRHQLIIFVYIYIREMLSKVEDVFGLPSSKQEN